MSTTNNLLVTQGPQGYQGPQGPTTYIAGPTGPQGSTGSLNFPYDVSSGDANFTNVGGSLGEFIINTNGVEMNSVTSSQPAVFLFSNNTGSSYSMWIQSNNGPVQIDANVNFTGVVTGITAGAGYGATGVQGPTGPQGATGPQGSLGPTGPSTGFPYDVSVSGDANFTRVGSGDGSFNITPNGINFNAITSSQPAAIQFSYNQGTSYSLWFDNTNGVIQFDAPVVFTNTVDSLYYDNSTIEFSDIDGGATAAMIFSSLTSSATASILYTGNYGSTYSIWMDNTNAPIRFDNGVIFGGSVSGMVGTQGPIGPTGPAGSSTAATASNIFSLFRNYTTASNTGTLETTIVSNIIPANTLVKDGDSIKFNYSGRIAGSVSVGSPINIYLYLGTSTASSYQLCQVQTSHSAPAWYSTNWTLFGTITRVATASVASEITWVAGSFYNHTTPTPGYAVVNANPVVGMTISFTSSNSLILTGQTPWAFGQISMESSDGVYISV